MSATLTHSYLIDSTIDLESANAEWANQLWQSELAYRGHHDSWNSVSVKEKSNHKTDPNHFLITLDKSSRLLIRQRQFVTLKDCEAKKSWIAENIPTSFGFFKRVDLSVQNSCVLSTHGFLTRESAKIN